VPEGISLKEFLKLPEEEKKLYTEVREHHCDQCKYWEFCIALEFFCPCAHKVVEMSVLINER